jgi:hypothetical protein
MSALSRNTGPSRARKYITDDVLELCRNPSRCPNSWTAVKNSSFAGKETLGLKAIQP